MEEAHYNYDVMVDVYNGMRVYKVKESGPYKQSEAKYMNRKSAARWLKYRESSTKYNQITNKA